MPATPVFPQGLDGSNCLLESQTLINLLATETAQADYDTASAVTLAPGGPFSKGDYLGTVEGGVETGVWVVEDACVNKE